MIILQRDEIDFIFDVQVEAKSINHDLLVEGLAFLFLIICGKFNKQKKHTAAICCSAICMKKKFYFHIKIKP